MGADNWATCPRCVKRHEKAICESSERVSAAYGTIPVDEWMRMIDDHDQMVEAGVGRTFRENYEITGVALGEVDVEYRGTCRDCDLSVSFHDAHPVEGIEE